MPIGSSNAVIPGCGMHHMAVQAIDYEKSLEFYTKTLGMSQVAEFQTGDGKRVALLDMGDGSHIELFSPKPGDESPVEKAGKPEYLHLALATTDTRGALEKVRAQGVEVTMEPKDLTLGGLNVTIAFVKGPSGESVEFFQVR